MLRTLTTAFALTLVVTLAGLSTVLAAQEAAGQKTEKAAAPAAAVNLNSASAADLERLPGIGPATAARIVEYRQKNGAFKKVEDLMNVRGIGEKTFLTLKPLITVAPPKDPVR